MTASWPNSSAFASAPFASGACFWLSDDVHDIGGAVELWAAFLAGAEGTGYRVGADGAAQELSGPYPQAVVIGSHIVLTGSGLRLFVCFAPTPSDTFVHPEGWPVQPIG